MNSTAKVPWQLWRDRRGRLSPLRVGTLALLLFPLAKALVDAQSILHGARPLNDLIHRAGFWALTFLGVTLAVTPLRRIARYGNLIEVRRMLGVGAFCYIAAHLTLFTADQMFSLSKVVHEISHRWYLIVGGTAWLGLATLAATSTDGMVKRLGGMRWRRLHRSFTALRCWRSSIISSKLRQTSRYRSSPPAYSCGCLPTGWSPGGEAAASCPH